MARLIANRFRIDRNPWVLILIGVAFTGFGIFTVVDTENTKDWPTVDGTVKDVDTFTERDNDGRTTTGYRFTIGYEVNGEQYETRSSSSSPVGRDQTRKVTYNPDRPEEVRTGVRHALFGWIFGAIGVLGSIAGVVLLIRSRSTPSVSQ